MVQEWSSELLSSARRVASWRAVESWSPDRPRVTCGREQTARTPTTGRGLTALRERFIRHLMAVPGYGDIKPSHLGPPEMRPGILGLGARPAGCAQT
jgi:hypothetical protein